MTLSPTEARLRILLRSALLSSALVATGCPPKEAPPPAEVPGPVPVAAPETTPAPTPVATGWTAFVCAEVTDDLTEHVRPGVTVDYLSLRNVREGGKPAVKSEVGEPCKGPDPEGCQANLKKIHEPWVKTECVQICIEESWVTTLGDEVKRYAGQEAIAGMLAPIDTPLEAWVVARGAGLDALGCEEKASWKKVDEGYQVKGYDRTNDCPVTHDIVELFVASDGKTTEHSRVSMEPTNICIGRLPEGIEGRATEDLGGFFAESARLEAASVYSFERLAAELQAAGAPQRLIARALEAAEDERRHHHQMAVLAHDAGADVTWPERPDFTTRTLLAVAIENATEGCVRETFGAAVGCHQARWALDPEVRHTMASIADDEIRHAALSWEVHRWLLEQLSSAEVALVEATRRATVDEALATLPEQGQPRLGLPDRATAEALLGSLVQGMAA